MLPPPAQGRLNHSMFISRMPIKAKPRRASKKSMRCAALTGPGNVLPESVPLDLFISDNSRFESSRPGGVAMAMTRTGEEHYYREPEPPGAVTFSSPFSPSGPEAASSGWKERQSVVWGKGG